MAITSLFNRLSTRSRRIKMELLQRYLPLQGTERVLDIGSQVDSQSRQLLERFPEGEVVACEVDADRLDALSAVFRNEPRVEVLHVVLGPAATRLLGAAMNAVAGAFLLFCAWRLTVKAQGLASYGDSTMFLHLKTAPLAWGMAAACAVSGLLMLALALTARERLLPRDAGEGGL